MRRSSVPERAQDALVRTVDASVAFADLTVVVVVVVGLVGLATGGTQSPLYADTLGTVFASATTPGAQTLDWFAAVTLGLVALGPIWRWANEGRRSAPVASSGATSIDEPREAFELLPDPMAVASADPHSLRDNGGVCGSDPPPSDWSTSLFGTSAPPVDASSDAPDRAAPRSARTLTRDANRPVTDRRSSESNARNVLAAGDQPTTRREAAERKGGNSADDPATDSDATSGATSSRPVASTGASTSKIDDGPTGSTRHLRAAIGTSRATVATVRTRVGRATTDTSADDARSAVTAIVAETDETIRHLRNGLPDPERPVRDEFEVVLARQRHLDGSLASVRDSR